MIAIITGVAIAILALAASLGWAAMVTPWLARRIGWTGQP